MLDTLLNIRVNFCSFDAKKIVSKTFQNSDAFVHSILQAMTHLYKHVWVRVEQLQIITAVNGKGNCVL